ncbi:hypothetical protein FB107DRAFT_293731 [Schizophyllum commune]
MTPQTTVPCRTATSWLALDPTTGDSYHVPFKMSDVPSERPTIFGINADKPVEPLPADAAERVIKEAKKEGAFAGLTGGLVSSLLGSRLFKFGPKTSLFSGVAAGLLSGYFFTEAFQETALAQLRQEQIRQARERLYASQGGQMQDTAPTDSTA